MCATDLDSLKKRLFEVAKTFYPCDLPIGVYLVTKDGYFVRCNNKAREILNLKETGKEINEVTGNINSFYCDSQLRIELMKQLDEADANGGWLEKTIIPFQVNGKKILVQDYCRPVKDKKTNEILGYTGCLVDVTEEENLRQLFEKLPIGVYKLDNQNRIIQVNKAAVDILGYDDPSELKGIHIKDLYASPKEAQRFDSLIKNQEYVLNERVELLKKSKERCYISVCAYKKTDADGETYIGREGTLQDVTIEESYRQIRDMIPVGTYMVRIGANGKEAIRECNQAFADMFEYKIEEIKGKEVKELYETEKDYNEFKKKFAEKINESEKPGGIPINAKTSKGRSMILEVFCRPLTDVAGNVVGRAGIVLDISNQVALHHLRDDIGKTLHSYSAALVTIEQSIKPIVRALGPDPLPLDQLLKVEKAIEVLSEPAKNLKSSLNKLLKTGNISLERRIALSTENWEILKNQVQLLEDYETRIPYPEFQIAALHDLSGIIIDIYNKIEIGKLPRELTKDVFNKAKRLEKMCCLINTHQALDTIVETALSIKLLREFVIFQKREPESPTVCKISTIIQNMVYQLYPFARHRKVEIQQEYQSCQAKVKIEERSVTRALSNLLYNAVKYSWFREGKAPWVTIRAYTIQDQVYVEFQNYGVPITKEEIDSDLIFRFGYRGKYSGDRRRIGTGIGLTDARETACKHGGDVIIKSIPASGDIEYEYSKPFLTTAVFILPLYEK